MITKFKIQTGLSSPDKTGHCSVRIRVSAQGRVDLYTGLTVKPQQWNTSKQRVKQGCVVDGYAYNLLNDTLEEQEAFVRDYFNTSAMRSIQPSLQDLKLRFNRHFKGSTTARSGEFFAAFEEFRQTQKQARAWKKDMIVVFERLQRTVYEFKPDITFSDLSIQTMDAFMSHLAKTMYNDTIKKNLSYLRQFVSWAKKRNYPIHEEFFTFEPRLQTANKAVRYLTEDELETIWSLDLADNEPLERTRDFFVFQCYTALRYSDLKQLKHDNIQEKPNGDYYLDILTEKDEDRLNFKLASRPVEIYKKYRDFLLEDGLLFPVLSNQKYNDNLKVLGKVADLQGEWIDYEFRLEEKIEVHIPKRNLSTHTARRTFVVLAYNAGIPLERIAMITSHGDISRMKPYFTIQTKSTDKVIDAIDMPAKSR